jgi:hypothetical protein
VRSSISSFDRPLVEKPWGPILGVALAVFILFAVWMEWQLVRRGFVPTIIDSQERWETERARASQLGKKALILIGASRIQLDIDLDLLREKTGLEPVQLALDGSTWMSVLAGLAADPEIRGTIIIDYYDDNIGVYGGAAEKLQRDYEKQTGKSFVLLPYKHSEKFLTEWVHERLRSYADGASPLNSFLFKIWNANKESTFVTTYLDRSRSADYARIKMPDYYYSRVARNLGMELPIINADTESVLRQRISLLKPADNAEFVQRVAAVKKLVDTIQARGGRVMFLAMPSSGMVREIEERKYPIDKFWKRFVEVIGVPAVRSNDNKLIGNFICPDGSHLDMRDRERFTLAMTYALGINRHATRSNNQVNNQTNSQ